MGLSSMAMTDATGTDPMQENRPNPNEFAEPQPQPQPPKSGRKSGSGSGAKGSPQKDDSGGDSDSKPIANREGKGWATSRQDAKATPVSRPIRIVVLSDRWLVRKEGNETQFESEIELSEGPQSASRKLEKSIRNRVDSWGLSLPGGYWCPSITMEAANDAQLSVQRLQRFLEGSGVEIRIVPLQVPAIAQPPNPSNRR
jgi:hypothetical protein